MDRVAILGALLALAGCVLLPFVEVRANRIVNGVPLSLQRAAGPWAFVLLALVVACGVAAILPHRFRGRALLAAGVGGYGALLFAAGWAAVRLTPGGASPARVSVGSGAWLVLIGLAIVLFQGSRSAGSGRASLAAAIVAAALTVAAIAWGGLAHLSLATEYRTQADTFWMLTFNHIKLVLGGAAAATVIGVPLGIAAARRRVVRSTAIPAAGLIQTIPSLALFGLLIVPLTFLGLPTIGTVPALIALTLYALLPIVRNTYLGVSGVDPAIVDAGRGMGMSRRELLLRVEMPLALPLVLEGLRAGIVLIVGIAAVMAIGGAQTLGVLVFLGFGEQAADLCLLGALPMVVLAIIADQGMRAIERSAVSPGIRETREAA